MNLRTIIFFFAIFVMGYSVALSQTRVLDSLNTLLSKESENSKKIELLNKLFYEQYVADSEKALMYAKRALKLSNELVSDDRAKNYISQSSNNVGAGYLLLSQYEKSLEFLLNALKIAEEIQDTNRMSNALFNLSSVYDYKDDMEKSYFYLEQSIILDEKRGDKQSAAMGYSSMAAYYFFNDEYDKGLIYYEKAMVIFRPLNDKSSIASLYGNRAVGLNKLGSHNESLIYHNMAINIKIELNDMQALYTSYLNIADVYIATKQFDKAIEFNLKSLEIAQKLNSVESIMISYLGLSQTYTQMKNTSKALEYTQLYANWKDTLYNQENAEAMAEMQTKYETEKKEAENSLLLVEKEIDKVELEKKSTQQKMLMFGLFLALILVVYIGYSLNQKKKTNKLLNAQNEEISNKNEIIEEKNKDITDSINYAQRIQNAILPEDGLLAKHFESFVYYKPKDIVSGDFYWIKEVDDKIYFSVVDCTGHGVPGAFMSIIGHNSLNRIIDDFNLMHTGEILDKMNELVTNVLGNNSNEETYIRDGMDMSICCIDKLTNTLEYSGAQNSLYLFRKDENKLKDREVIFEDNNVLFYEIKADKMAIGGGTNKNKYNTHSIQLEKEDVIYLFSDGYADQFGGPKGKKFMYKRFKKMLLMIQGQSMGEQLNHIDKRMIDWMGDMDQLDDICMMGIKI